MYKAQLEFPEGWGDLEKFPSVGELWIFSGTTQFVFTWPKNIIIVCIETAFPFLLKVIREKTSSKKTPKCQKQQKMPQKRTRMT